MASTDSSVAVGCLNFADGETAFTLGKVLEVDPGTPSAFQGMLKTPSRRIAIRSVDGTILEAPVLQLNTAVRIWTNHPSEPDEVIVGFE